MDVLSFVFLAVVVGWPMLVLLAQGLRGEAPEKSTGLEG